MIFCKSLVHTIGKYGFFNLSDIRNLRRKQKVFGNLLCNGRSTGRTSSFAEIFQITQNGAHNACVIDTGMLVKMLILRSNKSVFNTIRNLVNRHKNTFFRGIFHKNLSIACKKARCYRRLIFRKLHIIG